MKLKKLKITGFRSIKKEEELRVDSKITILIGANDHGKSNLLEAILRLNDDKPFTADDRNWDLPTEERMSILWHFDTEKAVIEKLKEMKAKPNPSESVETPPVVEGEPQVVVTSVEEPTTFPTNNEGEIVFIRNAHDNIVKVLSLPVKVPTSREADILKLRPQVEFFVLPHNNLVDEITLAQLKTDEFEFMQGIFQQAGLWDVRETIFSQTDSNSMLLDEASKKLTKILNDKWNQGKNLEWKLDYSGTNGDHIVLQIKDPSVSSRYTRPSLRSSGFKTYFLLSMIINARTHKNESNSYIYLFDEPGTYLHPHAQLDLQKSFEAISDSAQLVYTTHSLFLINKNYPDRNRVVSKTKEGTKIDQKPFVKNWKSVRESLGILLSNNFLIADKTLLTEGPSDVIYFIDAIKKLKQDGKTDIDLNDLSMVDAGTSENYIAMAKLMLSEGREVVALVDGNGGGKIIKDQLTKVCPKELKEKKLQICELEKGASAEDVFCDIKVLQSAMVNVFNNLITTGVRKSADGFDINKVAETVKPSSVETLGKIINDTTAQWFNPKEKMSKLSISLEYETLGGATQVPGNALKQVEIIRKLLKLKGEKSIETGVFEEVED